jgi:DGQHR domain-containing protein
MAGDVLRLPALEVTQAPGLAVYLFAVDGKQLGQFTTVSQIRRGGPGAQLLGYQRPEVTRHIEQIRRYLDSPGSLMPNALTVAFDDRVSFAALPVASPVTYARFGLLTVPLCGEPDRPGWLVDGQQRTAAITRAARTCVPVAVAAFIDADEGRQREQFVRVNATQPLPRSLLYDLLPWTSGPLPPALERRRLPAELAEHLNYDPGSPLYQLIRTTTNPDGLIKDNSVLRMLDNSIRDGALAPYRNPDGDPDTGGMLEVVSHFWAAVRDVFPGAWGLPPRQSRLLHGAGVIALGFLMDTIALHREQPAPAAGVFAEGLQMVAPDCRWTSGTWEFGRNWRSIQNTGQDARELSDYLSRRYQTLAGRRGPAGPGG